MVKGEVNMGNVIYLPKSYFVAASENKRNNDAVQKFLFGVSGLLIIYGLYRLVRGFEVR
jgi:hypothetical protein